ncbi:MAG: hypothetical protein QXS20_07140 [Candidatus Thorarchaeota archaeon]
MKYPFSLEARQVAQSLARDVNVLMTLLADGRYEYVVDAAEARVMAVIDKTDIPLVNTGDPHDCLVYTTARLIVEKIGNHYLKELQAEAESKSVNRYLSSEPSDFVVSLARESFSWKVEQIDTTERRMAPHLLRPYEFRMKFFNYLEVAPDFHDDTWKLVNRPVRLGWVPLTRSELNRLISGKFKKLILQSSIEVPPVTERMALAILRIESELSAAQPARQRVTGAQTDLKALPPCISQMYEDVGRGKSLSHEARFTLASFLLKIGMSVEDVTNVFQTSSDFVRGLAEYQVRHIASKSGGEGYTPPSCKKLQSSSLCPVYLNVSYDPLCEYVVHPLKFYKTRLWEISSGVSNHSWYGEKMKIRQRFKIS